MTTTMQPRDKRIPWYFVYFFVFIAAINTVMVTLAVRTHTGTVTEHPYEKGLAYNKIVAAEEAQAALGWKSSLRYADGALEFTLYDKNKKPLAVDQATASISRPTQAGMDFSVPLTGEKTAMHFPKTGQWEIRVDAKANGMHYQHTKRIIVE